jgi:hypothetical protein
MVPWHPKPHPIHSSSKNSVWQIGAENFCCGGCTSSAKGNIMIILRKFCNFNLIFSKREYYEKILFFNFNFEFW